MVVAAAYGAGLPVVATPVGGLAEQVVDGTTGVLARGSTSAADFADAIRRLIETAGPLRKLEAAPASPPMPRKQSPERFAMALGDAVLATVAER